MPRKTKLEAVKLKRYKKQNTQVNLVPYYSIVREKLFTAFGMQTEQANDFLDSLHKVGLFIAIGKVTKTKSAKEY